MRKNNRGATLTELVISISISAVIGSGIITFMLRQQTASNMLKYSLNMQAIYKRIEQIASNPEAIRHSASFSKKKGNVELLNCLSTAKPNEAVDLCTQTDPENQIAIDLLNIPKGILEQNQGAVMADKDLLKYKVSGTTKFPSLYDIKKGILCKTTTTPDSRCSIEVRSYFWATCPPNSLYMGEIDTGQGVPQETDNFIPQATPTTCITAQAINIRFQIVHNYAVRNKKTKAKKIVKISKKLPSLPRDGVFWKDPRQKRDMTTYNTLTTPVRIIPSEKFLFLQCPLNYTMTGIKDEEPICECLYPFHKEGCLTCGTNPPCVAVKKKCAANERYRGNKENGEPVCQPIYCEERKAELGCQHGGWIESIKNVYWNEANETLSSDDHISGSINNACAVIADACIIGKNGGYCDANYTCNQKIRCCYETEWTTQP